METVQVKIEFDNSLRRASIARPGTVAALSATVKSIISIESFELKYRDEEGDLITLGSDQELESLILQSESVGKTMRIIVNQLEPGKANGPEAGLGSGADEGPQIPFASVARALSDPAIVAKIQAAFASPVITESINQAAKVYVETNGNVETAAQTVRGQIPVLFAVLSEVLNEIPELKELQAFLVTMLPVFLAGSFANGFGLGGNPAPPPPSGATPAPFPPFLGALLPGLMSAFGGAGGLPFSAPPAPAPPAAPSPPPERNPWATPGATPMPPMPPPPMACAAPESGPRGCHPNVFCDGCGLYPELKHLSIRQQSTGPRGKIRGLRYKSQTLDDFDLCETCKGSGKFPDEAFGPFSTIEPPNHGSKRHGPWGHHGHHHHHHQSDWWPGAGRGSWRKQCGRANMPEAVEVAPVAEAPPVESTPKAATDPVEKWSSELSKLEMLGFVNSEKYVELLDKFNGNLDRVVDEIVRRDL